MMGNILNRSSVDEKPIYLSFPYLGPYSEKFKSELLRLLSKYFPDSKFAIVLVNKFTIVSFFNYEDVLPLRLRSSLVYKFSCARCASEYVGITSSTLGSRGDELIGVRSHTRARLTCPSHSAIRDHANVCDVRVDPANFSVLVSSSSTLDLCILESLHILKTKPPLNNQLSSTHCQ